MRWIAKRPPCSRATWSARTSSASTAANTPCPPTWWSSCSAATAPPPTRRKSRKGGLIAVGGLNLGGSVDPLPNAVGVVEAAVEKQAAAVLMPVSARRALLDLSDDMATKVNVQFYSDALLKALLE